MENMEMLKNDTELMEALEKAQSAEEIAALLRAKGYEVTDENAQAAFAYKNGEGELSEEMLDDVAGGLLIETVIVGGYIIGTIAVYGTAFALSKFLGKKKGKK